MKIPSPEKARELLAAAEKLVPGAWVPHSENAGKACRAVAEHIPGMDADAAYVLGLLHDIGRRTGTPHVRHTLDGYYYLLPMGFDAAARVCITHIFADKDDVRSVPCDWGCTDEELVFVEKFLRDTEYDEYDRLVQLCDTLALPEGFCLLQTRLVEAALRRGVNQYTQRRWKAHFRLLDHFSRLIGKSVYAVLPGVVENTFGPHWRSMS
jgi:hypothetical protein